MDSTDVFLNFNPPVANPSGVNWNPQSIRAILPFFGVNIGFLF